MTARQYFRVFARYPLLVAAFVVAGLVVAFVTSSLSGTTYTSAARVLLVSNAKHKIPPSEAYSATLLAQQRVHTYADLADSPELTAKVLSDGEIHLTAAQLRSRLEIVDAPNSTALTIVVRDSDSARTALITSRVTAAVVDIITEIEQVPTLPRPLLKARVVRAPTPPAAAAAPPAWRNPALGAAAGLLLGLAAAVALAQRDQRLRDPLAVQEASTAQVLGVVPGGRGRRRRDEDRQAAIDEIRTGLYARHPGPGESLTVAVTSPSADEAGPEMAGTLAAALAETGARVLLVDADLQRPHTTPLVGAETDGRPGLSECLEGSHTVEQAVRTHSGSRCDVLPAGRVLDDPDAVLHSAAFGALLDEVAGRYEFVLVSAPSTSLGTDALAVAARCDRTLVTVTLGRTTRPELESTWRHLRLVDADVVGTVLLA